MSTLEMVCFMLMRLIVIQTLRNDASIKLRSRGSIMPWYVCCFPSFHELIRLSSLVV